MKLHELDITLQREIVRCAGECLSKQYDYAMTGKNQATRILESVTNAFLALYADAETQALSSENPWLDDRIIADESQQDPAKRPYNRKKAE